jgi:hypothetical protein
MIPHPTPLGATIAQLERLTGSSKNPKLCAMLLQQSAHLLYFASSASLVFWVFRGSLTALRYYGLEGRPGSKASRSIKLKILEQK